METGEERLNRMLEFGVTTVEGKSGYGMDRETELKMLRAMKNLNEKHPVDIVSTFLGPHSVLPEWKGKEKEFLDEQLNHVMPIKRGRSCRICGYLYREKCIFCRRFRVLYDKSKRNGIQAENSCR